MKLPQLNNLTVQEMNPASINNKYCLLIGWDYLAKDMALPALFRCTRKIQFLIIAQIPRIFPSFSVMVLDGLLLSLYSNSLKIP